MLFRSVCSLHKIGIKSSLDLPLPHCDQVSPFLSTDDFTVIGDDRKQCPAAMKEQSGENDGHARDRSNSGSFPNLGGAYKRNRMNGKLAVVCNGLDCKNPTIGSP